MKRTPFPMFKHKLYMILPAMIILLFSACRQNTFYHSYTPVPGSEGWYRTDTLIYHLPATLPRQDYRIEIGVRTTIAYPYKDLWLSLSHNLKDSLHYETDTLHFYLSREEDKWKSNGNAANFFQHTYLSDLKTSFTPSDSSVIRLVHIMKDNPLPGICDLGIRLVKP